MEAGTRDFEKIIHSKKKKEQKRKNVTKTYERRVKRMS